MARLAAARVTLNHGVVETPIFMPVGTYGTVKAVAAARARRNATRRSSSATRFTCGCAPGWKRSRRRRRAASVHELERPILTDSGGFQVFSLGDLRKITDDGVTFASPINGDKLFLSPEISMQIQKVLNSDIVMQFDECTPYATSDVPTPHEEAARFHAHVDALGQRVPSTNSGGGNPNALFGIVQGGMFEELRDESLWCAGVSPTSAFTASRSAGCRSASRRKT